MGQVIQQISDLTTPVYLLEYQEEKSLLTFKVPEQSKDELTEPMEFDNEWCVTDHLKFLRTWFDQWQLEVKL